MVNDKVTPKSCLDPTCISKIHQTPWYYPVIGFWWSKRATYFEVRVRLHFRVEARLLRWPFPKLILVIPKNEARLYQLSVLTIHDPNTPRSRQSSPRHTKRWTPEMLHMWVELWFHLAFQPFPGDPFPEDFSHHQDLWMVQLCHFQAAATNCDTSLPGVALSIEKPWPSWPPLETSTELG